jgi:hypothetical protein
MFFCRHAFSGQDDGVWDKLEKPSKSSSSENMKLIWNAIMASGDDEDANE